MAGLGSAAVHPCVYGRIRTTGASQAVGLTSDTWAGEGSRSVSQSGAKRDNSQYRVRLSKSVRFPIADALKHEASANTISHRDKIVAVAVRCALRQASVAKMPLPAPQVLLTVFTSRTSLLSPPAALPTLMIQHGGSCGHLPQQSQDRRATGGISSPSVRAVFRFPRGALSSLDHFRRGQPTHRCAALARLAAPLPTWASQPPHHRQDR